MTTQPPFGSSIRPVTAHPESGARLACDAARLRLVDAHMKELLSRSQADGHRASEETRKKVGADLRRLREERCRLFTLLREAGLNEGRWIRDPLHPASALCLSRKVAEGEAEEVLLEAPWRVASQAPDDMEPHLVCGAANEISEEFREAGFNATAVTAVAAVLALIAFFTLSLKELLLFPWDVLVEPSQLLGPGLVWAIFLVWAVLYAGDSFRRLIVAAITYYRPVTELHRQAGPKTARINGAPHASLSTEEERIKQ